MRTCENETSGQIQDNGGPQSAIPQLRIVRFR